MDNLVPFVSFLAGLVLLVKGGDVLVKHAAHLAQSYRVPKTVVGAIVIGFGTSLPELFVSIDAAVSGAPGLALGNVIGSNIANVGLILGLGAFMASLHVERTVLRMDLPFGVLAALFLLLVAAPVAAIQTWMGIALLAGFVLYLALSVRAMRVFRSGPDGPDNYTASGKPVPKNISRDALGIVIGLVAITVGAELLVGGAMRIAEMLKVDDRVIGISLVAFGTSLPELSAMIAAARKGEADLAVGNIAGSNLFNLLFVLGTTVCVRNIELSEITIIRDLPVLALFSVLAFPLLAPERRIRKWQGLILLACYAGYIATTWLGAS